MTSLTPGKYRVFSKVSHIPLAWHQTDSVKVNKSSDVIVEIKNTDGGYQIRFVKERANSSWFGVSNNLSEDDRVLIDGDPNTIWTITSAGSDLYKISLSNNDRVWYIPDEFENGDSVRLTQSKGNPNELWEFQFFEPVPNMGG